MSCRPSFPTAARGARDATGLHPWHPRADGRAVLHALDAASCQPARTRFAGRAAGSARPSCSRMIADPCRARRSTSGIATNGAGTTMWAFATVATSSPTRPERSGSRRSGPGRYPARTPHFHVKVQGETTGRLDHSALFSRPAARQRRRCDLSRRVAAAPPPRRRYLARTVRFRALAGLRTPLDRDRGRRGSLPGAESPSAPHYDGKDGPWRFPAQETPVTDPVPCANRTCTRR